MERSPYFAGAALMGGIAIWIANTLSLTGFSAFEMVIGAVVSGGLAAFGYTYRSRLPILIVVVSFSFSFLSLAFAAAVAYVDIQQQHTVASEEAELLPLKVPLTTSSLNFSIEHDPDTSNPFVATTSLSATAAGDAFLRSPRGKSVPPQMHLIRTSSDHFTLTFSNPLSYPVVIRSISIVDNRQPDISRSWILLGGGAVTDNPTATLNLDEAHPELRANDGRVFTQSQSIQLAPQESAVLSVAVSATTAYHQYYFSVTVGAPNQSVVATENVYDGTPGKPFEISGVLPATRYQDVWFAPSRDSYRTLSETEKADLARGHYPSR